MADPIRVVVDALEDYTERTVRQLSVEITAELIENTPVDTGWARANWVPNIGLDVDDPADSYGEDDRRARAPSAAATQQAGIANLLTYNLDDGKVFISNNVPYITALNEGSSFQAPAGFVQDAIEQAIDTVEGLLG